MGNDVVVSFFCFFLKVINDTIDKSIWIGNIKNFCLILGISSAGKLAIRVALFKSLL